MYSFLAIFCYNIDSCFYASALRRFVWSFSLKCPDEMAWKEDVNWESNKNIEKLELNNYF